jgi:hypothetical protein
MVTELAQRVEKRLSFLEKSKDMLDWIEANPEITQDFILCYDSLIKKLNEIPYDMNILDAMPAVKKIKDTLNSEQVPTSSDFDGFEGLRLIVTGLKDATEPMRKGQEIKGKKDITPEDKKFAILTPSMVTKDDALVFGTLGHLWERSFFAWAEERNFIPEGGWKKDNFLHALDEIVMMQLEIMSGDKIQKKYPYFSYFTNSTQDGGLGWIKQSKIDDFSKKFWGELS